MINMTTTTMSDDQTTNSDPHNVAFIYPLIIAAGIAVGLSLICLVLIKVFHLNKLFARCWEKYFPQMTEEELLQQERLREAQRLNPNI
jgi:hypothetical protein